MTTALAEQTTQDGPETYDEPFGGRFDGGIYRCILGVSAEMAKEGISKSRTNPQQGYKFRGIDEVMNALAPMLPRHGLVILPRILNRVIVERPAKSGGVLFSVTVEAEFDFVCAADGSTHTVKVFGEAMDSGDKATNKAMSAAYKYAAFQTFCIPTEGDNDADATTHEVGSYSVQAPPPAPAPAEVRPAIEREKPAAATVEDRGELPEGAYLIQRVDKTPTKKEGTTRYMVTLSSGEQLTTIKDQLGALCQQLCQERIPVSIEAKQTKWGTDLMGVHRIPLAMPEIQIHGEPVDESEIPFMWLLALLIPALGMMA